MSMVKPHSVSLNLYMDYNISFFIPFILIFIHCLVLSFFISLKDAIILYFLHKNILNWPRSVRYDTHKRYAKMYISRY